MFISVLLTVWCSSINCSVHFTNTSDKLFYHATLRNEDILEMLPICYFWWMLTLLYLTCLSMYLRRAITGDAGVCRRGWLHPMSYSILHHLCNCILASNIYLLLVGTHVEGTDPRFDSEEELASAAADFGRALAKMNAPTTTYQDLPSMYSPVQSYQYQLQLMAMFCTVDVLSML